MRKYGFAVVEGPHDVEFVYRLLSPYGLSRVCNEIDLDLILKPLIPREYPPDGDLQKRMPTPLFLQSDSHSIAVHSAQGDQRLIQTIEENLTYFDFYQITGIGILLDSDKEASPNNRYVAIRDQMRKLNLALGDVSGSVSSGTPKCGAYVLPDNLSPGTLEDLLLECAKNVYPRLLSSAVDYVDRTSEDTTLTTDDLKDFRKPSGRNKAIIGTIASILRPGKAIQASIQDNRWLRNSALEIPRVKAVQVFLAKIFEL